jgi:hypothetical protein
MLRASQNRHIWHYAREAQQLLAVLPLLSTEISLFSILEKCREAWLAAELKNNIHCSYYIGA